MPTQRPRCDWASGSTVHGRYEVLRGVGSGASSVVYAARELGTNRVVALKRIAPASRLSPSTLKRIHREIKRVQDMRHPGIVPVHAFLMEGEEGVMITEFVPGQSLAHRLRQRGALSVDEVVTLGIALAETLAVAHEAGVVHRDIKPGNVMLSQMTGPRLTDFSTISVTGRDEDRALAGGATPGPHYLAPEVLAGDRGDARTDVYGLGLTLYVALINELPPGTTPGQAPVPLPFGFHPCQSARGSSVPRRLDDVIARATCASPADRFPGARDLALALEPLRSRQAGTCSQSGPRGEGSPPPRSGGLDPALPEALA